MDEASEAVFDFLEMSNFSAWSSDPPFTKPPDEVRWNPNEVLSCGTCSSCDVVFNTCDATSPIEKQDLSDTAPSFPQSWFNRPLGSPDGVVLLKFVPGKHQKIIYQPFPTRSRLLKTNLLLIYTLSVHQKQLLSV